MAKNKKQSKAKNVFKVAVKGLAGKSKVSKKSGNKKKVCYLLFHGLLIMLTRDKELMT